MQLKIYFYMKFRFLFKFAAKLATIFHSKTDLLLFGAELYDAKESSTMRSTVVWRPGEG